MRFQTAAEYLDASVDTIQRLVDEGRLVRHTLGGKDRLPRVDRFELDQLAACATDEDEDDR